MNRSVIQTIFILLLFIILGSLIYSNTLEVPFIFDDQARINENPYIRIHELTIDNLVQASFNKKSSASRPLGNLSFALNFYFHQYKLPGYHVVNIIIHILTSLFLYLLIKTTLTTPVLSLKYDHPDAIAFFTALIWMVHPLHTQSVTYIVQRLNSMAAMFYVLSFLLYAKGRISQIQQATKNHQIETISKSNTDTSSNKQKTVFSIQRSASSLYYLGAVMAWMLALGSKQNAAMLPFFIFLYEWYFFQDLDRNWLKRHMKIVFGVVILFGLTALIFLGTSPLERLTSITDFAHHEFTLTERIMTQFRVVIYYLSLLAFPHPSRLNLDHDFPLSHSLTNPITTLLCLVAIIGLIGLAVYIARKERLLSFCILWFFGNLVIESSVIPLAIIYEHRTYLPSMLVSLLIVILGYRYIKSKWISVAIMCAVISAFSYWTYQRNSVWGDLVVFWSDSVEKSPKKSRPHNNLGLALAIQGRRAEAIKHYAESLRINPNYFEAHINMGIALSEEGHMDKAIEHYYEALRIKPYHPEAHNKLGLALASQAKIDEAIKHYSKALELDPGHLEVHINLGNALIAQQGVTATAISHLNEALLLDPKSVAAYNSLGIALIQMGKIDEAMAHFRKALQIDPDLIDTHVNLGGALTNLGKTDEAIVHFRKALQIKPDLPEVHINLGVALAKSGKVEEAVAHFRKALHLDPDNAEASYNLNNTLATLKEIDREISNIQAELVIAPDDPKLHYHLGIMYQAKGQWDKAQDYYTKALSLQPDFPEALYELAKLYIARSKNEKALALYQKMIAFLPDNPAVYYNVACIYARQNKPEETVAWLKKAVAKGFNDWEHIKTDRDLDNIRSSIQYKKFVKGH